jgi:hypothetical protein
VLNRAVVFVQVDEDFALSQTEVRWNQDWRLAFPSANG